MSQSEAFSVNCPTTLLPGRLATFKQWPFTGANDKCVPKALAEAGFVHRPDISPDSVQCFSCQKILDGWNADVSVVIAYVMLLLY